MLRNNNMKKFKLFLFIIIGIFFVHPVNAEPVITLLEQYPSTLYLNSTGDFNLTWGITHDTSGLNNSSIAFVYTMWDAVSGYYNHSIRPPNNDMAVYSILFDEQIIRANNRNEILNFENNVVITEGNIWKWGGMDENCTELIIESINDTYTKVHINTLIHDHVFSNMWYLDRSAMQAAPKTQYAIYKDHGALIKFWDTEAALGYAHLGCAYLDTGLGAVEPTPSNPIEAWYVNKSYNPSGSVAVEDSPYAFYMTSLTKDDWVDFVYIPHVNSSYAKCITINSSDIENAGIKVDDIAYIYLTSQTNINRPFYLNVTNADSGTNVSFADTNVMWSGIVPFTQHNYTPNMFISMIHENYQYQAKLYTADNNDLWGNSSLHTSNIEVSVFPPTVPSLHHILFDEVEYQNSAIDNQTFNGIVDIFVGVSTDPDGGLVTHNLTLHYQNETLVTIINNTFAEPTDTFAEIEFNTTPYYSTIDEYTLRVIATDNEGDNQTKWLGYNFSLYVPVFYNVSGYVFNINAIPISNATISNNQTVDTNVTNVSGYYILSLENGSILMTANASGYISNSTTAIVNGANLTNVNITLDYSQYFPSTPTNLTYSTYNFGINYSFIEGVGLNNTDSYNITFNGTQYNGVTDLFFNESVEAHGYGNITIYAYNSTNDGVLSAGFLTNNITIPNNNITITNTSSATVDEGETVYVDYDANDADGDTPIFSCNRTDLFTDFDTATGIGNWITETTDIGTHYVDFGVSDGYGSTSNYTMNIVVELVGTEKWNFTTGGEIFTSPAIAEDGTIYVSSDDLKLYAIYPNGTEKWNCTTETYITTAPTISQDGTIYAGDYVDKLHAFYPNGTLRWSYNTSNPIYYSSPAIAVDGSVYFGCSDSNLYALYPNGTLKWNYTAGNEISYSSPAIATDGTIYVGSYDNNLYALNPNGTLKWNYTTGHRVESSPAIATDGTIYVGSKDNNLYAIHPNGSLRWNFTTGNKIQKSSPAIASDGTIYVGSHDDNLYAIYPNGTKKWNYTTDGSIGSSPTITSDGTIYVSSYDGKLYAIHQNGTKKWSYTISNTEDSSPVIALDGTIYASSYGDNSLHAFEEYSPPLYTQHDYFNGIMASYFTMRRNQYDMPSASITGLTNVTGNFWHNWTWTNPTDSDFNHTMIYLNNIFTTNVSNTTSFYNYTVSAHNTSTISTHTVDITGNINTTWVNHTSIIGNNPITITNTSDASINENENVYVDYNASDADGDTPTFTCNRTDLFIDFDTANGTGNWQTDFTNSGTYYVDFGVSDGYNSTSNYTMIITITDILEEPPISSGLSTVGTSKKATGGVGSTGEIYENIIKKEVSMIYFVITNKLAYIDLKEFEIHNIKSISFMPTKNWQDVGITIEKLNTKSIFAETPAPHKIYSNVNIWVGKSGYSENNLKDAQIEFIVEKDWLVSNAITQVTLMQYNIEQKVWEKLPTKIIKISSDKYTYIATTQSFSPFAIVGESISTTHFIPLLEKIINILPENVQEPINEIIDDNEKIYLPIIISFILIIIVSLLFTVITAIDSTLIHILLTVTLMGLIYLITQDFYPLEHYITENIADDFLNKIKYTKGILSTLIYLLITIIPAQYIKKNR